MQIGVSAFLSLLLIQIVAYSQTQVHANLNQLMRGTLFPASNVVFAAQTTNPAEVKAAERPSMATDPLASAFGGWQAVENAALALAESANLLVVPGRKCANGVDVPLKNPDWVKFVQELRDAGMKAFKAAQSKNQDNVLEVSDTLATACAHCHGKWREKLTFADRCK
jgi:hypothetical protein